MAYHVPFFRKLVALLPTGSRLVAGAGALVWYPAQAATHPDSLRAARDGAPTYREADESSLRPSASAGGRVAAVGGGRPPESRVPAPLPGWDAPALISACKAALAKPRINRSAAARRPIRAGN